MKKSKILPVKEKIFTAIIEREGKWYVSLCPELDVASQGKDVEEAIENLKEAVELYLDYASKEELTEVLNEEAPLVTTIQIGR